MLLSALCLLLDRLSTSSHEGVVEEDRTEIDEPVDQGDLGSALHKLQRAEYVVKALGKFEGVKHSTLELMKYVRHLSIILHGLIT